MTTITAALVKELRDRTNGTSMMECKAALQEANGDIEKAIEIMRKSGQAKAVKKAGRTAAEGTIVVMGSDTLKEAALIEVNCETDFVAREEKFKQFAKKVGQQVLEQKITSVDQLQALEQARLDLISQLGENVTIRRLVFKEISDGIIGAYGHGDANSTRIGALVILKKGSKELARDLAMQVAAMNPEYVKAEEVPADRLNKEKEIFMEQTREEGKPEAMLEKIVAGKLKKFTAEITLLGQSFVKDQNKTIEALLKESNAEVASFVRFEVGEGIEKKEDNFVQEVMAQVRGS